MNYSYRKNTCKLLLILGLFLLAIIIDSRWRVFIYIPICIIAYYNEKCVEEKNNFHWSIADIGIFILIIEELFFLLLPSFIDYFKIESVQNVITFVLLWLFLRYFINNKRTINILLFLLSFLTGLLSIITLWYFLKHRSIVTNLGFSDMIVFRSHYHPIGFISNDWVAVLVCLIPFPIVGMIIAISKKMRLLNSFFLYLIITSMLVSFSRACYLSLLFVLSLSLVSVLVQKKYFVFRYMVWSLFLSFITVLPERESIYSVIGPSNTVVQIGSNLGRIKKFNESIYLSGINPVTGLGSGSYGIALDYYVKDKRSVLTQRSTNSYMQLLVEKGYIGSLLFFSGLFLIMAQCFMTVKTEPDKIPFFASLLALGIRELFFSSFFIVKIVPILSVVLVLLIIQCDDEKKHEKKI